jgi:Mg-chelatase subunit ChlD
MNVQVKYIESQRNPYTSRKGGVHLKGLKRDDRQPVHLLFLIDVSGSMDEENRLDNVRRSMNFILPFLTADDQISLITFSDTSEVLLSKMAVNDTNKRAIEYKVGKMCTVGNTNLSAGLLMCSNVFEQPNTDSIERKQGLVVLTDGHANAGARDDTTLIQIVKNLLTNSPGLSITCVGYGENHNSDIMSKMGIEGGGSYNIVKNLEDVATVFGEILGGLLSVAAQVIEVLLPPGAECDTVYPKDIMEGGITKVRIGDIYAEAEQTLIFKSSPSQGPVRITGVAMPSLERINQVHEPLLLAEGEDPDPILKLADYRQQVSMLLKRFRCSFGVSPDISQQAGALKVLLENSSLKDDPLVLMMLDDLKTVLRVQAEPDSAYAFAEATTSMAQHEAYLGVARGLRTPSNAATQRSMRRFPGALRSATLSGCDEDPTYTASPPGLSASDSVFSNPVQRHITQTLRSMTSQQAPPPDSQEVD